MQLLNNQYRVLREIDSDRFLVRDLFDGREKIARLIDNDYIKPGLLEYYSREYTAYRNIACGNILKSLDFGIVKKIDGKPDSLPQYYMVSEYTAGRPLDESVLAGLSEAESLKLFADACRAVHYLHICGTHYGGLCMGNLFYDNGTLKLRDLASVIYERENGVPDVYFTPPGSVACSAEKQDDIYALGVLLFCLVTKKAGTGRDFRSDFDKWQGKSPLRPVIERAASGTQGRYGSALELLQGINSISGTAFPAFHKNELEHINAGIPLVGRETEEAAVWDVFDKVMAGRPAERYVRVSGALGTGKTAFLKDLRYRMYLRNINVYGAFDCAGSAFIKPLLSGLLDDCRPEEHSAEIIKQVNAFSGGAQSAPPQNTVLKFVYDCMKDKPAVFIIDAMETANEYVTDTLDKLASANKKLLVVYSCRDGFDNEALTGFINKTAGVTAGVEINPFTEEETALFIRRKLSLSYTPGKFTAQIYRASQGNALFAGEILKTLQQSGHLYISDDNGDWVTGEDDYSKLPMPGSMQQAAGERAARLGGTDRHVLTALSVFDIPVTAAEVAACAGVDGFDAENALEKCRKSGDVSATAGREDTRYIFTNKILRSFLYAQTSEDERRALHGRAADALRSGREPVEKDDPLKPLYEEITRHLEQEGRRDALLVEFLLAAGLQLWLAGENKKSMDIHFRILGYDTHKKPEALVKIGLLYDYLDNLDKKKEYYQKAYDAALIGEDIEQKIIAFRLCMDEIDGVTEKMLAIFDQYPQYREKHPVAYFDARVGIIEKETDTAKKVELFEQLYSTFGPEEYRFKSQVLHQIGHYLGQLGRHEASIEKYRQALSVNEKTRGERLDIIYKVMTMNNLVHQWTITDDFEAARSMLYEALEYSKTKNYEHPILFVNLVSIHLKMAEYDKALPVLLEFIKNNKEKGLVRHNFSFGPYLFADKYNDAYEVAKILDEYDGDIGVIPGFTKSLEPQPLYFSYRARFCLYMDELDAAAGFLAKEKEDYDKKTLPHYEVNLYEPHLAALRDAENGNINEIPGHFTRLLKTAGEETDRQDKLNAICEFFLLLHNCGVLTQLLQGNFRRAYEREIERIDSVCTSPAVRAKWCILKSLLQSGSERADTLLEGRRLAKAHSQPLTHALICRGLGEHFRNDNKYLSLYHLAESCQVALKLLDDVPGEFREGFIRRHNLITSYEGCIHDVELREPARALHFARLPQDARDIGGLIRYIGADPEANLELMARYMAAAAFAARCEVLIEDAGLGFITLASDDGDSAVKADVAVLRRAGALSQDILSTGGADAFMCMPVPVNSALTGFVYLYADSVFNNITKESLDECKALVNLLALNIGKQAVKRESSIDKLTGALNRKAFDAAFDELIEVTQNSGGVFSLIMSDLDKFKSVNDVYGHQTGDDVLRGAGRIFREHMRKDDIFGRYGGEEFVVLLKGTDAQGALTVAEKLRAALDGAKLLGSKRPVTGSMGIAVFGMHGSTKAELISNADKALYACKENGRNQCRVYDESYKGEAKSVNTAGGIITGDTMKDGARMRAVLDIIGLIGRCDSYEVKTGIIESKIAEMAKTETGTYDDLAAGLARFKKVV